MNVTVCGPGYTNMRKRYVRCPSCECVTEMVVQDGHWWGVTHSCCRCGDRWSDGELCERPFRRGWRQAAIRRHREFWDAATFGPFDTPGEAQ